MPAPNRLKLNPDGFVTIQSALTAASKQLLGNAPATLALADAEGVFLECQAGAFDPLYPERGLIVASDDVMWFASCTKLVTAVCYLHLVDHGTLTLDTDMRKLYPQLDAAASQIIAGFEQDKPIMETNDAPITLRQMLNMTSGFAMDWGDKVTKWKAAQDAGFASGGKLHQLVSTPLSFAPGTSWEYGTSFEWLGLMLPHFAGMAAEDYFQKVVFQPLGMRDTSLYPDHPEWKERFAPLRYRSAKGFEEVKDQPGAFALPRSRDQIVYASGGGGLYSTSSDFIKLLHHLLQHKLSLTGRAPRPKLPLLSDASLDMLFTGSLSDQLTQHVITMFAFGFGTDETFALGEGNWSAGMAMYTPKDRRRRMGWGRRASSVGWGGSAGAEYWIDVESGLAAVFATHYLQDGGPPSPEFKNAMEKAIYDALE